MLYNYSTSDDLCKKHCENISNFYKDELFYHFCVTICMCVRICSMHCGILVCKHLGSKSMMIRECSGLGGWWLRKEVKLLSV